MVRCRERGSILSADHVCLSVTLCPLGCERHKRLSVVPPLEGQGGYPGLGVGVCLLPAISWALTQPHSVSRSSEGRPCEGQSALVNLSVCYSVFPPLYQKHENIFFSIFNEIPIFIVRTWLSSWRLISQKCGAFPCPPFP